MEPLNPYQSPTETVATREPRLEKAPETLGGAVLQGTRLGVKWITIILGPIAVLTLLASIGFTVYLFCFVEGPVLFTDPERRWEVLRLLGSPFGFYLVSCMWGIIAGLLVCVPLYFIRRIAPRDSQQKG